MKNAIFSFAFWGALLVGVVVSAAPHTMLQSQEEQSDLSQSRFVAIWSNRDKLLGTCLYQQNLCNLNATDIGLVRNILKSSVDEKDLIFSSARENPGHFGGVYSSRSLVGTLSRPASQIYVNTDVISMNGQYTTPLQALTHLFAAWTQHQGLGWQSALIFSQKLAQFWVSRIESTPQKISTFTFLDMLAFQGLESFFILIDQQESHDLTPFVKTYLVCSGGNRGLAVMSARRGAWTQFTKTSGAQATYQAEVTYVCGHGNRIMETWTAKLNLYMVFEIQDNGLVLNDQSLRMRLSEVRRAN